MKRLEVELLYHVPHSEPIHPCLKEEGGDAGDLCSGEDFKAWGADSTLVYNVFYLMSSSCISKSHMTTDQGK